MDIKKSHQNNFGLEAMPILFHSQTSQFIKLLDRDGLKLLNFWWNHVGDQMPEPKRLSSAGMAFDLDIIDDKTQLVTITLPSPKEDGDPYFLALVARPERRFGWVRIPNSHVYALCRADKVDQPHKTLFGELTPRAFFRERGLGLIPTKADFKRIVKKRLEPKNRTEKSK
jgi:hypothetical protein